MIGLPREIRALAPVPYPILGAWLVDLDEHFHVTDWAVLSLLERARANRFKFDLDARRFVACRHALRIILAACTGTPARGLCLCTRPGGKPFLAGCGDIEFSVSHSAGLGLIAVSASAALGVDLEVIGPVADAELLVRQVFTSAEQAVLASHPCGEPDRALLWGWTRKEACLKATGMGMAALAPLDFEACTCAPDDEVRIVAAACSWTLQLHTLEAPVGSPPVAPPFEAALAIVIEHEASTARPA